MTSLDSIALHRALGLLMAEVARHSSLGGELARARREFLGAGALVQNPLRHLAAETRFAEWYLLERESEVLGEVPVHRLARGMVERPAGYEALLDSTVSAFRVEGGDEIVSLRDLQDRSLHEMVRPVMLDLSPGDLLVGRLFASDDGYAVPSAAVAVRPEADELLGALESDLLSLELERRLTQVELEHLLFRRWEAEAVAADAEPVEDIERELARLFASHRLEDPSAAEVSEALRETAHPGAVMGPLLDHLAFDTNIDLEQLRALLLQLWNAHAVAGGGVPPASPITEVPDRQTAIDDIDDIDDDRDAGLGERLARRIEAGRAEHEDMEKVFEDIADMLGEDLSDEADDGLGLAASGETEEGDPLLPDFAGDLEPLIGEFLWEEECAEGPEAEILAALLAQQQEAPVPNLDLESLRAADLLRLLLRFYLESTPPERCDRTQRVFEVLERFCLWAQRTQEYSLSEAVRECRESFVSELARLHRASLALSSTHEPPADRPGLWRVLAADDRRLELVPLDEDNPVAVRDPVSAEDLRSGDLMLAAAQRGADDTASLLGMVVVLPAAAEALLG